LDEPPLDESPTKRTEPAQHRDRGVQSIAFAFTWWKI
jgi:hypothetical protein